jgi:hypothetical protein
LCPNELRVATKGCCTASFFAKITMWIEYNGKLETLDVSRRKVYQKLHVSVHAPEKVTERQKTHGETIHRGIEYRRV